MTREEIEILAAQMGARVVGEIPGARDGATGVMNALGYYQARMRELNSQNTAASTDRADVAALELTLQPATLKSLGDIAARISTPGQQLDAAKVAGAVLDA